MLYLNAVDSQQIQPQSIAITRRQHGLNARFAVSPSFVNSTRSFGLHIGILIHLMGIFRKIGIESDSDTDLLTHPSLDENLQEDDGGHDRFAHYVKKEKIVESAVTGKAVKALCGKKWTPSRDPEKYPICPTCKDIHAGLKPDPEDK
jgi:hypothetical protein